MDDRLTQKELAALLSHRAYPCVSLYMPTHRDGVEMKEHAIRFKNLVAEAHRRLVRQGMKEMEAERFLAPLRERAGDTAFWREQSDGFAAFLSPSLRLTLRLPHRLPTLAVVERRLYVKPLIQFVTRGQTFHVLAMSEKAIRLYDGSPYGLTEVPLENVPRSLGEALQLERTGTSLQMHSGAGTGPRGRPGLYHGQEPWTDKHKRYVTEYLHRVEENLRRYWHHRTGPLVFAGVDSLHPLYAEVCTYPVLSKEFIAGNPDGMDTRELQERALNIARPLLRSKETAMEERYRSLAATGNERAMDDVKEIVPAAYRGRVMELMVADDAEAWGVFDPDVEGVRTDVDRDDPASEDLLDLAVVYTMEHGGDVFARPHADVPGGHAAVAVQRY